MRSRVKVGVVGCGKISDAYFAGSRRYDILEIAACADLDPARAQAKAREHGIARALTVDQLLADPAIEIVLNLTIPAAHVEINERALRAGKHAYTEKPFALNYAEARRVLDLAKSRGLRVGCAPDTFLGGGLQTCRQLVDAGAIGRPAAALGFCMGRGPESWHPSPDFVYQKGGGPMFDMGPYYLTALINLFGPAVRVTGSTKTSFPERVVTHPDPALFGRKIAVETPTHFAGVVDFANGASASLVMSFDVWPYPLPFLVVFGSESTLEAPDPNTFAGPVRLRSADGKSYADVPLTQADDRGRGTGLADLAHALRSGRPHRASGELAAHVVEVMEAFATASATGRHVAIASACPARRYCLRACHPAASTTELMKNRKFRIGLIGTGGIARATHLPAWKDMPDVEIHAVADVMGDRARAVAREYGIPHAFSDYRDLLKLDLDAVDICAPNRVHTPATLAALAADKHVLCEKPLAVSTREVRQMGALADRRKRVLMTAQVHRFTTAGTAIKAWADGGRLGEVYHARVRAMRRAWLPIAPGFIDVKQAGGGPCMDIGVHALDECLWLMGFPKPVRVSGVSRVNFAKGNRIPNMWGEWDRRLFSVEDFAAGFVHFENGATLTLEASWMGHQPETEDVSFQLFGLDGGLKWPSGEYSRVEGGQFVTGTVTNPQTVEKPFLAEIRAFHHAIVHRRPSPVPWTETIKVMTILEAIYESQKRGKEIVLR